MRYEDDRLKRLSRGLKILRFRGLGYVWYVVTGVVVPLLVYRVVSRVRWSRRRSAMAVGTILLAVFAFGFASRVTETFRPATIVALAIFVAAAIVISVFGKWSRRRRLEAAIRKVRVQPDSSSLVRWRSWVVEPGVRSTVEKDPAFAHGGVVDLGFFDNDGRFCSSVGKLPGLKLVEKDEAERRYRFDLGLVLRGGRILVRKSFRGNRAAFNRECECLLAIPEGVNAPRLEDADLNSVGILKSFVPGRTAREHLVDSGAQILSCTTDVDPELQNLDRVERIEAVWRRGRETFDAALPSGFLVSLEEQLDRVHRAGVTGLSLTFGNVVIHEETGEPWFIDFDAARVHRSTGSLVFRRDRDRDRELFNRIYGTDIVTEAGARQILKSLPSGYAPVDLGGGLVTRGFWSVDSGTGRWEYLNGKALEGLFEGKRILDLGCNNGVMSLMMLREGARAVVGVERSPEFAAAARALHRVFEWRDMRRYDFTIDQKDMIVAVDRELEGFDLVTAFCSLYYLDQKEMGAVASRVREVAPMFVVQAKSDTRKSAGDRKAEKSSPEYLERVLRDAGLTEIRIVGGEGGYTRPLLIAGGINRSL